MTHFDLVILRHGKAESFGRGGRDEERALTEKGTADFTRAAKGLARLLGSPVEIVSSPYLRARQTAKVLLTALKEEEVEAAIQGTLEELVPHGTPDPLQDLVLDRMAEGYRGTLVLITHMPLAGDLVGDLALGGRSLTLGTGEACCLRIEPGGASLAWKLPEALAALVWDD